MNSIQLDELLNFKVIFFKKGNMEITFGIPKEIEDEGSFFRIGELNIVTKYGVDYVEISDDNIAIYNKMKYVKICYQNGDVIELGICI